MNNQVDKFFDSRINDIRDPIVFLGSGFFLGLKDSNVWMIGICFLFLYAIFLRRKKLIYLVFWREDKLKVLFFINLIIGFILGYNQKILSENYPVTLVFFLMVGLYFDRKCFIKIIKDYIKNNLIADNTKTVNNDV